MGSNVYQYETAYCSGSNHPKFRLVLLCTHSIEFHTVSKHISSFPNGKIVDFIKSKEPPDNISVMIQKVGIVLEKVKTLWK